MNARIKNQLDIFNLLKNIQKSKQLISLSFEGLPQYCLTTLLDVHYDARVLKFDEPNPELHPKILEQKTHADFSLKYDHLPVRFRTALIAGNSRNKNNDLYTLFPDEIYYPQQRNFYRLSTEFLTEVSTTIFLSASQRIPCQLINISLTGLCIRLPFAFAPLFQVNTFIDDIYIELPNQKGFSVSAKILNSRVVNHYSNIDIGLEITHHKPAIEKTIQQFIFRADSI